MGGRCQLCVNEPCIGKNPLDLTCLRKGPANAKGRVATDPKEIAGLLCQVPKGSARFWILRLERGKVPLELKNLSPSGLAKSQDPQDRRRKARIQLSKFLVCHTC